MFRKIAWLWVVVCLPVVAQKLPDGPGKQTLVKVCSNCHPAETVVGQEHSREEWEGVVGEMANAGAEGTQDEFVAIVNYLAKNFPRKAAGKININKATVPELATGLELLNKEAEAIVHYRQQNGEFKTVDDLKKVPDLDFKKIEAKKDRLAF